MDNLFTAIGIIAAVLFIVGLVVAFCLRQAFGDMSARQATNDFVNMRAGDGMHQRIWRLILWMVAFCIVFVYLGWWA